MVKIPSLEDLKKIGSDFVDSAKSGKLGSVVDKVKSGIESVGSRKPIEVGDEAIQAKLQAVYATLKELGDTQAVQASLMKKIQDQISELTKTIESTRTSSSASPDISQQHVDEDKKS